MEYRTLPPAEYADLEERILYEDNNLLIVNQAVGDIVQGDKTGDECLAETYKAFLAQRDGKPGKVFLGIPHRLDRPVSGITVLAKTSKALERLSAQFREGQVHKTYWALCCARPEPAEAHLKDWMVRNEKQNKSYVIGNGDTPKPDAHPDAKRAELKYRFLYSTEEPPQDRRTPRINPDMLSGGTPRGRCCAHIP